MTAGAGTEDDSAAAGEAVEMGAVRPPIRTNEQLLRAVQSNDVDAVRALRDAGGRVDLGRVDLGHVYGEPYLGTILDVCCASQGRAECAEALLSLGADPNAVGPHRKKTAVHLAAANGRADALAVLLEHGPTDVNAPDGDGNTALHLAAKAGDAECAALLLGADRVRANLLNRKGFTAAYLAAVSRNRDDRLMLEFIRSPKVDLDILIWDKPLRDKIIEKYPHLAEEIPPEGSRKFEQEQCDNLFVYLYSNDIDEFISQVTSLKKVDLNSHDGKHTYLQYACNFGFPKVVQTLLDLDVDPNGICDFNSNYPLFIASYRGFADIVQIFLNSKKNISYQTNTGTALLEVVKGADENHNALDVNTELCDHSRSFKLLLKKSELSPFALDINQTDDKGNTCLHYAAKINDRDFILALLDQGAYVGKRNVFGDPPLADISHKTLESHLNKCVKTNGKSPKDINYEIIFAYNFLCPPKVYQHDDVNSYPTQLESQEYAPENVPETDPLLYISEVPELRPLLSHPVLTSFIHLKWLAIKRYYKVNLAFYIGFWALLTAYTLLTFEIGIHNSNLSLTQDNVTEFSTYKIPFSNDTAVYLWVMVLGFLIALIFRELFQFVSSPLSYVTSVENWLEICLFVLTSILLLCEMPTMSIRNQISAIVILLSWGELILLVGRHPALATNLEMFKRVTKTFLRFLVWYSILIFAFALSFYMMFRNDLNTDNKIFNNPETATFKTIVMLTGEFDTFGSLPFDLHPFVSHAVFLLFIFLVAIVLVNLLNGLAVSDTQEIRADAEIVAHVSRVKLINYFEKMAVGDMFSWIHKIQNRVNDFGYGVPSWCTRRFDLKIMLFPDALQDSEIRILPNQNNFVNFGLSKQKSQIGCVANCCEGYYLQTEIVNDAKSIIKLNSEGSEKNCTEIMEFFVEKFNGVDKAIKEIKKMLNALSVKSEINSKSPSCNSIVSNGSYQML